MDWPASTTDIGVVEKPNRRRGERTVARIAQWDRPAGFVQERRERRGQRPYLLAGPILDYGTDGPATLGRCGAAVDRAKKGEGERWEWKFATSEGDVANKIRASKRTCLFPSTWKPKLQEDQEEVKVIQSTTEQAKSEMISAISLNPEFAGIDLSIIDTLFDQEPALATIPDPEPQENTAPKADLNNDPIVIGNRLVEEQDPIVKRGRRKGNPEDIKIALLTFGGINLIKEDPVYFIAFPTGEDQRELNISPFRKKGKVEGHVFCPTAKACMTFPSPILQIAVSSPQGSRPANRNTVYLAIRLELFTYILSVDIPFPLFSYRSTPIRSKIFPLGTSPVQIREIDRIDLGKTDGARHVEVVMHPRKRRECMIVDEKGRVWRWRMVSKTTTGSTIYGKLSKFSRSKVKTDEEFYRIAWHDMNRSLILITSTTVEIIDGNSGSVRRVIDFVNSSTRILDLYTHVDTDVAPYACILTTETLVWFDPVNEGRIMLSWKHYLPRSDKLRLLGIPGVRSMTMAVLSTARGVMTAFQVQEAGLTLKVSGPPYDLYTAGGVDESYRLDSGIVTPLSINQSQEWCFFHLGTQGELSAGVLRTDDRGSMLPAEIPVLWSRQVIRLAAEEKKVEDHDQLWSGVFRPIDMDLQKFWAAVPEKMQKDRGRRLQPAAMRRMLVDQEELYGTAILTGADLAALASDKMHDELRLESAFLRGYDLDYIDSLDAIEKSLDEISTLDTLTALPVWSDRPVWEQQAPEALPNPSIQSLPLLKLASNRLRVDLRLAGMGFKLDDRLDVDSARKTQRDRANDVNESGHLDAPELSYLRRKPKDEPQATATADASEALSAKNLTLHKLLSQWELGDDPAQYIWPGETAHTAGNQIPIPSIPPFVAPVRERQPSFEPQSQPVFASKRFDAMFADQSQDMAHTSTQVVPGPFGSRNLTSVRKSLGGKKRTIGF